VSREKGKERVRNKRKRSKEEEKEPVSNAHKSSKGTYPVARPPNTNI
jgi:hypothetical protein